MAENQMTKKINLDDTFNLRGELRTVDDKDDGYIKIEGYANVAIEDRVGTIIPSSAWIEAVEHYVKNPIILFNHNYDEPVGKATRIKIDKKGLFIECNISPAAQKVQKLIKEKILKSFSVGFRIPDREDGIYYDEDLDTVVIKSIDLLEVSVVTVPANQESLFDVKKSFTNNKEYLDFVKGLKTASKEEQADREYTWSAEEKANMTDKVETVEEEMPSAEEVKADAPTETKADPAEEKVEAKASDEPEVEIEAEDDKPEEKASTEEQPKEEKATDKVPEEPEFVKGKEEDKEAKSAKSDDEPEVTVEHDLNDTPEKIEEIPVEVNLSGSELSAGDLIRYDGRMHRVHTVVNAGDQEPIYKLLPVDTTGVDNDNVNTEEKNTEKSAKNSESLEANQPKEELQNDSNKENEMENKDIENVGETTEEATPATEAKAAAGSTSVKEPRVAELVETTGKAIEKASDAEDTKGAESTEAKAANDEVKELRAQLAEYQEQVKSLTNSKMAYATQDDDYLKSDQYKKDAIDAVFIGSAFGKDPTETKVFQDNMARAVTDVDSLLTTFSTTVYEEMEQELVIAKLFDEIKVTSKKMSIPHADEDTADGVAQFANGTYAGAHDTTRVPTSKQHVIKDVEFTPHKYMVETHIAKDETEDTIIPVAEFLRKAATRRLARAIDKTILRGDGSLTGFNPSVNDRDIAVGGNYPSVMRGVNYLCTNAGTVSGRRLTVSSEVGNQVTPMDIARARQNMGKYGVKLGSQLVFLTTIDGYNELVTYPDFRTLDKMGKDATYLTGTLGSIYGINVIMTEFLDTAVGATAWIRY